MITEQGRAKGGGIDLLQYGLTGSYQVARLQVLVGRTGLDMQGSKHSQNSKCCYRALRKAHVDRVGFAAAQMRKEWSGTNRKNTAGADIFQWGDLLVQVAGSARCDVEAPLISTMAVEAEAEVSHDNTVTHISYSPS